MNEVIGLDSAISQILDQHSKNIADIRLDVKKKSLSFKLYPEFNELLKKMISYSFGEDFSFNYVAVDEGDCYGDLIRGVTPGIIATTLDSEIIDGEDFDHYNIIENESDGKNYGVCAQLGEPCFEGYFSIKNKIADGSIIASLPRFYPQAETYRYLYNNILCPAASYTIPMFHFTALDPNINQNPIPFRMINLRDETIPIPKRPRERFKVDFSGLD